MYIVYGTKLVIKVYYVVKMSIGFSKLIYHIIFEINNLKFFFIFVSCERKILHKRLQTKSIDQAP